MPKTRIKKKTNTTGGFQDLGYTLTEDEITSFNNKVDKVSSTDNAIARFNGTTGAIQNSTVKITDAGKIIAPSFASDATEAGMVFSDNNELNFGSNSDTLYIGYRNKLNTSGAIGIYNFGTSSGSTGMQKGRINAGDIYSNGTKVATISDLSGYVPTSRKINTKTLTTDITLTASEVGAEPAFEKNTAFNKNFGTAAGTVCQGNDSRLSNARTPTAHTHTKSEITDFPTIPTIPTVNNGTLTIQKNGTSVATFTANQSTNATANITVPTKTSDLTNDSGFITSDDLPASSGVISVVGQTGAVTADQIKTGIQTSGSGFACGGGASATTGGAIGSGATATTGGAVGLGASTSSGFAGGQGAVASWGGVAIGYAAQATITEGSSGYSSIAIGNSAQATKKNAVQLGYGTNSTADTLQFRSYQLLDANGNIPNARLSKPDVTLLGTITGKKSCTFSSSIANFRFIMLINLSSSLWRTPYILPVSYIEGDYTRVYGIESWDGSRYRFQFENATTGTITAEWYTGTVYIYGLR